MASLSKRKQSSIIPSDIPHYYEVHIPNHPNGVKKLCCGSYRDVEPILERYPGSLVDKIYPPKTPSTVDVPHWTVKDQELPMQQILPQSELEEFNAL